MPVSAQEHRVRTGLYSSCKGVWLSRHKLKHFSPTTKTRSSKEETECNTTDLKIMWFLATVILLVPLMYTTTMIAITVLEVLLQINLSTSGGTIHDVSHQAKLDLSWVINIFHFVREICSWLAQHRRMVTLLSLFCVLIISTVTAVIGFIRRKSKQSVHNVVFAQIGMNIVIVQKLSVSLSCQRLMGVSLVVAILTAILISLMLIKSGDVELNPGPLTGETPPPKRMRLETSSSYFAHPGTSSGGPSNSPTSAPVRLVPNNLNQVFEAVYNVRPKWYEFGLALGLSPVDLESIKLDNHEKVETCLREAILKRLCKDPLLTWNDIVRALRQRSVAKKALANEIVRKHHLVGPDEGNVMTLLDQMRSALSEEPTLEELCSLPVERVWYSLGLWLRIDKRRLDKIKRSAQKRRLQEDSEDLSSLFEITTDTTADVKTIFFGAFLNFPVGTRAYETFIESLKDENLKKQAEKLFGNEGHPDRQIYEQLLFELMSDAKETAKLLFEGKVSVKRTYDEVIAALVKVGKRDAAEHICSIKGVSLTVYLDATDPSSNPPECVENYASYLKCKYNQMSVLPDEDWPPAIVSKDNFTNLALIERDRDHLPKAKESETMAFDYAHGKIDSIVARKHDVELEEAFLPIIDEKSNESRLTILMDGAPGVGKTTIARNICIKWANGELLEEYQLVIFIPLREVVLNQRDNHSIADLLPTDDPSLKDQVVKHLQQNSNPHILFIFDGFDELTTQQRTRQSLFLDVIKGTQFHRCSVLVTSRPYASDMLRRSTRVNRHVEVLGFTKKQIADYVRQHLREKEARQLVQKLQERLDIDSLCYIPLNCRIVLYVYSQEGYELPATLTQLYEIFVLHTIKHYSPRMSSDENIAARIQDATRIQDLPDLAREQIESLSELAFSGIQEDKLVFENIQLANSALKLGLMNCLESFNSVGVRKFFQFLHLTIQEFLAARYLASKSPESITTFLKENFLKERFRMTMLFLSGLTKLQCLPQGESLLAERSLASNDSLEKHQFIFLAQVVYESEQPVPDWLLSSLVVSSQIDMSGHRLSQFDCLVLANFISSSPQDHTWEFIDLSGSSLTDDSLDILLRYLTGNYVVKKIRLCGEMETTFPGILEFIAKGRFSVIEIPYYASKKITSDILDIIDLDVLIENTLPQSLRRLPALVSSCADLVQIAETLLQNCTLQELSLSDVDISISRQQTLSGFTETSLYMCPQSFKLLSKFMNAKNIQFSRHLEAFQDCPMCDASGREAVESLCELIDKSTELQNVNLSHCQLSEDSIVSILTALATRQHLEHVNLDGSDISTQAIEAITKVMPINVYVCICNLSLRVDEHLCLSVGYYDYFPPQSSHLEALLTNTPSRFKTLNLTVNYVDRRLISNIKDSKSIAVLNVYDCLKTSVDDFLSLLTHLNTNTNPCLETVRLMSVFDRFYQEPAVELAVKNLLSSNSLEAFRLS